MLRPKGLTFNKTAIAITVVILSLFSFMAKALPQEEGDSFFIQGPDVGFLYFAELEDLPSVHSFLKAVPACESQANKDAKQNYMCDLAKVDIKSWQHYGRSLDINPKTQALFFGERHLDQGTQIEFSNLLYVLKAKGYSTLAMEMFPKSTQKELDLYNQGQMTLDELIEVFSQHWFYEKQGYKKILTVAKNLNMKIIGLDDRTNPLKLDFWADFYKRDSLMANNLAQEIVENNSKVVVYTGSLHSMKSFGRDFEEPTLSQKLKLNLAEQGIEIQTQNFIFRNSKISRSYKALSKLYTQYENQNILISSPEFSLYSDGVIYLRPDLEDKVTFL